ncbi:MAG: hypothetical protein IID33_09685 [Planctomycetes bacterium]|nr:hypothetical protein [Planctomycetota bacterium]
MATRFVILHHIAPSGEHWDLMLERGDALLTWQLACEPTCGSLLPLPARRIGDHRKAYLDYEGPVSRDRGHLRRVDAGTVEFEEFTPERKVFSLRGGRLTGRFVLAREGREWVLSRAEGS